jgi:hypothetical protein
VELHINEEIVMEPGFTRFNTAILDDKYNLNFAKEEIKEMLAQLLDDWDPQKRLKYFKVVIRSLIDGLVGCSRKGSKEEIYELVECLNVLHNLKVKACSLDDEIKKTKKSTLDTAINRLDEDLRILRLKKSSETSFRARANWCELC